MSFALNLAVPPDKVLKAKQTYCAPPKGGGEGLKETGGQGDEANSERTQVRNSFHECIHEICVLPRWQNLLPR